MTKMKPGWAWLIAAGIILLIILEYMKALMPTQGDLLVENLAYSVIDSGWVLVNYQGEQRTLLSVKLRIRNQTLKTQAIHLCKLIDQHYKEYEPLVILDNQMPEILITGQAIGPMQIAVGRIYFDVPNDKIYKLVISKTQLTADKIPIPIQSNNHHAPEILTDKPIK